MTDKYLAAEVALWWQQECGDEMVFLGCYNLTGVSAPRGARNPHYCRVGKNKFKIKRVSQSAPGLGSATVVANDNVLNYVQEAQTPFNLYALYSSCGADEDPTNFDFFYLYEGVGVESEDTDPQVIGMDPDDQTEVLLSMPVTFMERLKVKALDAVQVSFTGTTTHDINDVCVSGEEQPTDVCDDPGPCEIVYMVTNGDGVTPAKVLKSTDGGSTWTVLATPFTDTSHNIDNVVCDGDVVVVSNGESTEYAYTWNAGTSWSVVTTPTQLIYDMAMYGPTKIWMVCQNGYIYYSSNRGQSVTLQDAGVATTDDLNAVSAASSTLVYAVGDNNAFVRTADGGSIWSAVTGPSAGNNLKAVCAIEDTDFVFVGDDLGNVFRSKDRGDTWTTVLENESTLAGGIADITACTCNVVVVVGNDLDPYFYSGASVDGVMFESIDGGNTWMGVELDTNDGVNAVVCCDPSRYWVVGEAAFAEYVAGPTI